MASSSSAAAALVVVAALGGAAPATSTAEGPGAARTMLRANRVLVGANSPVLANPLAFVERPNATHGWTPPVLSPWVTNHTSPLQSAPLVKLLAALRFGGYRYPGGSNGNWWDWTNERFSAAATNCSVNPECSYYKAQAAVLAALPPGAFGVAQADELARAAGSELTLTLDVSTTAPDPAIAAMVAARLPGGSLDGRRVELGNEVYDPRQGPPPSGYRTAQEYLASVAALAAAVRKSGGRAGVVVGPCPFFYGDDRAACWGGPAGRYHQWQHNLSQAYLDGCHAATRSHGAGHSHGVTSASAHAPSGCPFDAVVAHNYATDLAAIAACVILGALCCATGGSFNLVCVAAAAPRRRAG